MEPLLAFCAQSSYKSEFISLLDFIGIQHEYPQNLAMINLPSSYQAWLCLLIGSNQQLNH